MDVAPGAGRPPEGGPGDSVEADRAPGRRARWQERARRLKRDTLAVYLAYRHPRTPWYAQAVAVVVAAYAFSPIDLIPDPIPVLGYLDDLLLVPLGIALALRLIPPEVMAECRARADSELAGGKPVSWAAAAVIVAAWLLALLGLALLAGRLLGRF